MKIRKSELKNIIDNGWLERREKAKARSARYSELTKEWKKRVPLAQRLIKKLEQSENPYEQANAQVIKELLKMIEKNF